MKTLTKMWYYLTMAAKKAYKHLVSRPSDTWLHICVLGGIPALTIGLLSGRFWCAMAVGVFLATWKELYDRRHPEEHTAEWRDFINTLLGALIGAIIATI